MKPADLFKPRTNPAAAEALRQYARAYDRHIAEKLAAMQRGDFYAAERAHDAAHWTKSAWLSETR